MKKTYLLPLGMLAVILAFSLWSSYAMEVHTSRWREQLQRSDALAQAEDWPGATQTLVDGYQDWCGHQSFLHILTKHDYVDQAETMYNRAIAFAAAREPGEFRAELANLDAQLELLAEAERLNLRNVL